MVQAFLIVLVDRQHGQFFRYNLQSRRLERQGEAVVDDVPKTVKAASWAGLADDKVARHVDAHLLAHLKHVARHLAETYNDPAVIIGGPEEIVVQFLDVLPSQWRDRVEATIHPQSHLELKDLEARIQQAADQVYQAHLAELLMDITEAGRPAGRGVIGQEPVYEALTLKQVQLVVTDSRPKPGYVCPNNDGLSANPGRCAVCFCDLIKTDNLQEALLTTAAGQDAEVVVLNDASLLPANAEGVVALKRYVG